MYGRIVVCCITFICLSSSADVLDHSDNIHCFPRPAVVPVSQEAKPYFVELHQCQGSVGSESPRIKRCVAKTWNTVTVKLTTSGDEEEKTLKNHTSCDGQCTPCHSNFSQQNKDSCICTCNLEKPPSGHECGENYVWNSEDCQCECNLREDGAGRLKTFDKENCKFVCKKRNCGPNGEQSPENCRCRSKVSPVERKQEGSDNIPQGTVIAALVVGEFVFLYLIFDSVLYSKKTGLMHYVKCRCRGRPAEVPEQNQPEARRCLDNEDVPNNVPLQNVVVDSNGQSRVATDSCQHVTST